MQVRQLIDETFPGSGEKLHVGGIDVEQIAAEFGTPVFVYDQNVLLRQWELLRSTFPSRFDIHYSVKANPNLNLLTFFLAEGAGLEIASAGELHLALEAGCAPHRILFAGPGKTPEELELALKAGVGEIHAESITELERIAFIAAGLNHVASVAIRVNPDNAAEGGAMRMGGKATPFGIDEEQLPDALNFALSFPSIAVTGIHLFSGTQLLDAQIVLAQYRKGLQIARQVAERLGRPLRGVDFGGGLGVPYFANEHRLDMAQLKLGLADLLSEVDSDPAFDGTRFIVEPGRYLTAEAGLYLTRVLDVKVSRGKRFVIVDGGMNHHLAASGNLGQTIKRNFPIAVANRLLEPEQDTVDIVGPLCTPLDTLARSVAAPNIQIGDLIAVLQSGAYSRTASPLGFLSHPAPPEVLVAGGEARRIRRRGSVDDYLRDVEMVLPASLANQRQAGPPVTSGFQVGEEQAANAAYAPSNTAEAPRELKTSGPLLVQGRILIVAFHFPPLAGSSGLLRSLKFCRYLPEFGWTPTVLTVQPGAYERVDDSQLADIPNEVKVIRTFGLDTRRHLSIRGAYPRLLALPDRWSTWLASAVPAGLRAIRKHEIDVIFTTFPIATAVLIGYLLHRLTGKPWIVDLRDSMTEDTYPPDLTTRRLYRWIERKAVRHAAKILFTAQAAIRMYRERYPELEAERCVLLPNGYDEADFAGISPRRAPQRQIRLLHSGLIYPWERDPRPLFRALARLKAEAKITAAELSVELRACGAEAEFQKDVSGLDIDDMVHFLPPLPYRASLQDGADADALLLLQAGCCDHQVPAKAYEYLRLNKPMLALTTASGDTAALLNDVGGATIADLADEDAIYDALLRFLGQVRARTHPLPCSALVSSFSRRSQAERLADALGPVVQTRAQDDDERGVSFL